MSRLWMISYDIQDDRCRRRVHNLLKDCGERVQYSVFECWLDEQALTSLQTQIREELANSDNVRWYPLCSWCRKEIAWQGKGQPADDPEFYLL